MVAAVPVMDTPDYVTAAETATRELNAAFLTVMLEGRSTDAYLAGAGSDAPAFTDAELQAIGSPVDFAGINVYRPNVYVTPSDEPPGYRTVPISASHPTMGSAWHVFDPEVMYWAPRQVTSIWGPRPIFITENGCAAADQLSEDGHVYDSDRVMFLRACLGQLQRATSEGRAGARVLPLERPGQPRMALRLRRPVRPDLRGLRDTGAHPKAQRSVVPGGRAAERSRLRGVIGHVTARASAGMMPM
jgi:beta-glucosidase/6-phospho-beta-glucosidase/beta-galactosidase